MAEFASAFFSGIATATLLVGVLLATHYAFLWRWRSFSDQLGRSELEEPLHELETFAIRISNSSQFTSPLTESHRFWRPIFGLHRDGLSVRLGFPYGILAQPIFLPYEGMSVSATKWPLLPGLQTAITHKSAPGVVLIIDEEFAEWAAAREPRFPQVLSSIGHVA